MKIIIRLLVMGFIGFGLVGCTPCFCDHYIFSEVDGVVHLNGKPLPNVEVIQYYRSEEYNQSATNPTTTDNQGKFHFPAVTKYAFFGYPVEPVNEQKITIVHNNTEYKGWWYFKHNYDDNGEIDKKISLTCDLSAPDQEREGRSGPVAGICDF